MLEKTLCLQPRKVRKLKILTGFRPVSDQFQTLCPERTEKRIQKNRLSSMSEVNGYRKSKGTKDLRKITQLNLLKMYGLVLVVLVVVLVVVVVVLVLVVVVVVVLVVVVVVAVASS